MSKHTPGPWEIGEPIDSRGKLVYIPIRAKNTRIATTGVYGRNPDGTTSGDTHKDNIGYERHKPHISADECGANARLIAAAPELLAACDTADTAFAVININRNHYKLVPQAEAALREAWAAVNKAMSLATGRTDYFAEANQVGE